MRTLMMTSRVDAEHDVMGFTVEWIRELSGHFEHLHVLTGYEGRHDLPENVTVRSYGKERGMSKPRRILEFWRHCRWYRSAGIDVIFSHMIPNYVIASWPFLHDIPYVQWYAHGEVTWKLRLAHRLVAREVTPTVASFNLQSEKLAVVGHGIDMNQFAFDPNGENRTSLLGVGRIDPVKNFDLLVDAVELLRNRGREIDLTIVGEPVQNREYYRSLVNSVEERGLGDTVEFVGSVPHDEIIDYYHDAGVFLNGSVTGSLDKVEIEAAACGTPVVSCNRSYREMIEESDVDPARVTFDPDAADGLAETIETILDASEDEYRDLCSSSRAVVERQHALDSQMGRIADLLRAAAREEEPTTDSTGGLATVNGGP